ncbi:MAG: oligosaccharide flippase family protein [Caldilineaceae bacterium]|nr:oligosaccharide flippase family protein [Caldilineaceae bacterium]
MRDRLLRRGFMGQGLIRHRTDLLALLILFLLPLIWFAPVLFPFLNGRTLLPFDNLYSFEPWRNLMPGLVPHNQLLSDLVLENAVWKLHIRRTLADGQLPLWNPQIFTGVPFLAAGQASTFYPLSLLFYILPLPLAYGWFTALQVGLAGMGFYAWARTLKLRPLAALGGGVVYMFSGFLIASVVFTMFIAAVAWLPLILAVIEWTIRKQEEKGVQGYNPLPYVAAGAGAIGVMILAGHPELIYYTLLVAGLYTVVRLGIARRWLVAHADRGLGRHINRRLVGLAVWLLVMALLGIALGGVQLLPLLELLPLNFREGSASLDQVRAWAWPDRHLLTFWLPDVFGNPSHHAWFDIWARQWRPVQSNAQGEAVNTIFWGIKNYVEGANYLGILTWLLAAVALGYGVRQAVGGRREAIRESVSYLRPWIIWFCAGLALISLLFAFGTPLYGLLYSGLPGWKQLHSPFRWVFPFTLSMAMLAAVGLHLLPSAATLWSRRYVRMVAGMALVAGLAVLGVVALSLAQAERFRGVGEWLLASSDLARATFQDGGMAWSYEAFNLARFGLWAVVAGLWLWLAPQARRRWGLLAVVILAGDLYWAHGSFNPAAPVELSPLQATGTPPVVEFMQAREPWPAQADAPAGEPLEPWRFTTFNAPGEKTFQANVGMYYGWHDLRGYDSIIPRQYVALMEQIAPQANELLYNQIAPLYSRPGGDVYAALDNPLLDLLNVKYILSEHHIPNPGWTEVYRDASIGVYENSEAFPRAWIVPQAVIAQADRQPLLTTDLRQTLFIEEMPAAENALVPASPQLTEAQISRYTANDLFVDVNLSDRGWLVVGDAYFPGWKAFVRPFGSEESEETELPIYRANGSLRAVYLPEAGQWTVRLVYSPMSFKLGLYTSFLAGMTLLLLGLYWLWGRYYRPESTEGEVRTVAKNSLVPMGLSLINKAIDFAFAMLYVRLLGPVGTGQYAFVVAIYGFFEIISRYGLGTLLTRDVAADKDQSSRYLTNVMILRTLLWLASLPLLALVVWGYRVVGDVPWLDATGIGTQEIQAIAILALAMLFANWADALSSLFYAFEKMEYPAGLTNAIALLKVTLGALVLLLGWGYVGLAAVSLAMNIVQVLWLYLLVRTTLFRPQWQPDRSLQRFMLKISGPLMLNHLLATIFWRIDVWILRPLAGAASVGLYSVGLKYLDGLNIVPSVFTMAIFPLMSRYARQGSDNLLRSYVLSLRLLVLVSLPIAMSITILAEPLVWLVGGAQYLNIPESVQIFGREFTYLGGSDLALQVIIWSIPIGFVNSVTQYVLIAVNQQHYLTRAFIMGVVFNVVGNLLVIPRFGYVGAAIVTILSEFSLLFPFYYSVRRHVGVVPWANIIVRPLLATAAMGGALYALTQVGVNLWAATAASVVVYAGVLWLLGALRGEEMAVLRRALSRGS